MNPVELTNLFQQFIKYGIIVKDPNAIVGLPFALAKLSCEKELFYILKKEDLQTKTLDLCLNILAKRPSKVRPSNHVILFYYIVLLLFS